LSTVLSGQDILDRIRVRLGGLSNAFTVEELLSFAEDGVQEVWATLKSFDAEYFGQFSQDSDSATEDTYFADLLPSKREYDLPPSCREIRAIECLTTSFESCIFEYRRGDDPVFQSARRDATASGSTASANAGSSLGSYYYTVFGNQLVLAQYPESTLNVRIWFIQNINLLSVETELDTVLYPFAGKIVDYAVQKAMASTRDVQLTVQWIAQWKMSVQTLGEASVPRSSGNPIFIVDYQGG